MFCISTFEFYKVFIFLYDFKIAMSKPVDGIRQLYINNPPEGMTAKQVKNMSEDDLLDMHYFLTEDDFDDEDEEGAEGFYLW